MDIRKIALYLSGKIPPDYIKFSRLEFFEHLEIIYEFDISKQEFYWRQAKEYEEELYFLVIDYLYRKSTKDKNQKIKFDNFIEKLSIPDEVLGISGTDFTSLKNDWEKLKLENNSQAKWKLLENFLEGLFDSILWIEVVEKNMKNEDEEIDLVLKNNVQSPFFQSLNSPIILVEAKNWAKPTPTKESRNFGMKCLTHKNLTRVWIFVAVNWFTDVHDDLQKRTGPMDYIEVLLDWSDIEDLLDNNLNPINWLEDKIIKSLK